MSSVGSSMSADKVQEAAPINTVSSNVSAVDASVKQVTTNTSYVSGRTPDTSNTNNPYSKPNLAR